MEHHDGTMRDRPVGDLVKDATQQAQTLIRQEVELAKAELSEKGKQAGIGAGMFGGAGLVAVFGFGALTAAAIAGVVALLGKSRVQKATPPLPERAIDSTKQDIETTKARVKEARR